MDIIITLKIEDNWMLEPLNEWNYSHRKYFNWLGIVTRDEDGNNQYNWLKDSNNCDEYFNISQVKQGDILYSGCKNQYKERVVNTAYYGVLEKTNDTLKLVQGTSYLKIKNYLKETNIKNQTI